MALTPYKRIKQIFILSSVIECNTNKKMSNGVNMIWEFKFFQIYFFVDIKAFVLKILISPFENHWCKKMEAFYFRYTIDNFNIHENTFGCQIITKILFDSC